MRKTLLLVGVLGLGACGEVPLAPRPDSAAIRAAAVKRNDNFTITAGALGIGFVCLDDITGQQVDMSYCN